jgi:hypothetical protein
VIMPSGCSSGASGVVACADVVRVKAKAIAINLIIMSSHVNFGRSLIQHGNR